MDKQIKTALILFMCGILCGMMALVLLKSMDKKGAKEKVSVTFEN